MPSQSTDPNSKAPPPARNWQGMVLTLLRGLAWIAPLPALLMAIMSGMIFDASGSENSYLAQALFMGLVTAPVVTICTALLAGQALRQFSFGHFLVAVGLPLGWGAYIGVVVALLDALCDGQFTCAY